MENASKLNHGGTNGIYAVSEIHGGTTKAELGRNPDVHHIVPVRAFVETAVTAVFDAHYLENVVSLCPSCHRKAEFGHVRAESLEEAI